MTPMKSERFRLLHIISILLLILSIEATTSSRSITTSSTPSAFPGRKKIQTKLSLLVDDDDDHRKCCDFTKKKSWNAPSTTFLLSLRGGSDEEEKEDESSSLSTGIDTSVVLNKVADVSKKALVILGKATMATAKAFQRAIQAGLQGDDKVADDDDDEEEPVGVATKVFKALKRMIKAAFTFPTEDDDDDDDATFGDVSVEGDESESGEDSEDAGETSAGSKPRADFGSFLENSYGVVDGRDEFGPPVLGGTLSDALQTARSQARLLVVYTPMARPSKNKKSKDHLAIQSILSSDVAAASNKRARKGGEDSGSFLFWGARSGSSEATSAIKRLKAKVTSSKGEKRPILSVVYPAQVSYHPIYIYIYIATFLARLLDQSNENIFGPPPFFIRKSIPREYQRSYQK